MPLCSDPPRGLPDHQHVRWERLVTSEDLPPILSFTPRGSPLLPASTEPRHNPLHATTAQQWFSQLPDDTARSIVNMRRAVLYTHTAQVLPHARPMRHPGAPPPEVLDTLSALCNDAGSHPFHLAGEKVRATLGMPSAGLPASLAQHGQQPELMHSPYTGLTPQELQLLQAHNLLRPPPTAMPMQEQDPTNPPSAGSWFANVFKRKPPPGQQPGVLGLGGTHPTVVGMPLPAPGQPMPPPGFNEIPDAPDGPPPKPKPQYDFDPRQYPGDEPEGPQPWYETMGAFANMNYKWNKLDVQPGNHKPKPPVLPEGAAPALAAELAQGPVGVGAPQPGIMPGDSQPFVPPPVPPQLVPSGPGMVQPLQLVPPPQQPQPGPLGLPAGAPWLQQQQLAAQQLWQQQPSAWQQHPGVAQGQSLHTEIAALHGELQRFPSYPPGQQPAPPYPPGTQYPPQGSYPAPYGQQPQPRQQQQYPSYYGQPPQQYAHPQQQYAHPQQQYGQPYYPPAQQYGPGQYNVPSQYPNNQYSTPGSSYTYGTLGAPAQYGQASPYGQPQRQQTGYGLAEEQGYGLHSEKVPKPKPAVQGYGLAAEDPAPRRVPGKGGYGIDAEEPLAGGKKPGYGLDSERSSSRDQQSANGLDKPKSGSSLPPPRGASGFGLDAEDSKPKAPLAAKGGYGLDAEGPSKPSSAKTDRYGLDSALPSIGGGSVPSNNRGSPQDSRSASPAPAPRKDGGGFGLGAETSAPVRPASPALGGNKLVSPSLGVRDEDKTLRKPSSGGFGLDSEADPPAPKVLSKPKRDSDSDDDLASQRSAMKAKSALASPDKAPLSLGSKPATTAAPAPSLKGGYSSPKPTILPSSKGRDSDSEEDKKPVVPSFDRKPLGFGPAAPRTSGGGGGFGLDTEAKKTSTDQVSSKPAGLSGVAAKPAVKPAVKPKFGLDADDDF